MYQIGKTLTQVIIDEQNTYHYATGNFTGLLHDISLACKKISSLTRKGDLIGILGNAASENIQGETQKKMDIITNNIVIEALSSNGHAAALASEEMDHVYHLPAGKIRGRYLVTFDPLDGSSNMDVNVSVGTIFSILKAPEGIDNPSTIDFMRPGVEQVAAGYCLYGPSTIMVLTTGNGVHMFGLDWDCGSFLLTRQFAKIPEETNEFAINASNQRYWDAPTQRYISECLAGKEGPRGKNFNMRWVASMVAEVHRILTRGGVFLYTLDSNMQANQLEGKLRLLYEANPISLIVEQAGGLSSTGHQRTMEVKPTSLHQRVPLILGSKNEVQRIVDYYTENQASANAH